MSQPKEIIITHKPKPKTRRGRGFKNKSKTQNLVILGNNVSGFSGRVDSFNTLVKMLNPAVTMLQESKLYKKGTYKLENHCVFEKLRESNEGGGLMTIIHENLEPVLIPTENSSKMSLNVLVVEAKIQNYKIRFINSYGVQENSSAEERAEFYSILEEEIIITQDNGRMLCLEMDANAKLGHLYIKGDPNEMSPNGKLLLCLIKRYNLIVINGTDKCSGVITRMRTKGNKTEKSVIDFFIVCQSLYQMVVKMDIDEERRLVLTKFSKNKKGQCSTIESDHNPLKLEINLSWNPKMSKKRTEIYNLRNKECQASFKEFTNNSDILTKCLIQQDIKTGGKIWLNNLKFVIMQTF